jgi:signal transduction histidine kinase/ActR/RegA family two-component response regulator
MSTVLWGFGLRDTAGQAATVFSEASFSNPALPMRLFALCLALTSAVFVADLLAPTDIIFSLSYAVPLFLCAWTRDARILWSVALLAAFFNCAAYAWGVPPALTLENVTLNRALSALQILVVAGLLHLISRQAVRLERINRLSHAVLQQMPAGVVISEAPSGIVRLVNERAAMLWRDPSQPNRAAFENGGVPGDLDGLRLDASTTLPLSRSLRSGVTVAAEELHVVRADRTSGVLRTFSAPVLDRNGKMIAAVMTFADMTDLKRIENEREDLLARECAARAEAERANRTRDEFFANLSHELRAPLGAVRLWVALLRTGDLSREKAARALELIEGKVALQARLIDDLLDVSRIIFGKLRLDVSTVDLTGIVESSVEALRPDAEAKNLSLGTVCSADSMTARADAARLQQIVGNLVSNAIKFTPDGGTITVGLRRQGAEAEISVTDTGEGIPAEFLPHAFEGFQQAERVSARRHDGLGLGLKIVRHLVELHRGTITVESAGLGQGATFTVRLPILVAAADAGDAAMLQPSAVGAPSTIALHGVRALVVDDDSVVRDALVTLLERYGARTVTAGSVSAAMNVLARERVDVLLTDIAMPAEDGYALLRRIRALPSEGGGNIPAVAITAHAEADDRARALAAGFAAHFPKPPDAAQLVTVVAGLAQQTPSA